MKVFRFIVERRSRQQHDFLLSVFQQTSVDTLRFANLLKFVVFARAVASEAVSFIDDDEVKLFLAFILVDAVEYFIETSVGDKLSVFENLKAFELLNPSVAERRRINDEYVSVFAV